MHSYRMQHRQNPSALGQSRFHTGADFESGQVHATRGRNEEQPPGAVAPEPLGVEAESGQPARGVSGTGLAAAAVAPGKKRKPAQSLPARMGAVWASVRVVGKEYETNPDLECKECGKAFGGGITRIEDHIIKACCCESDEAKALKAKVVQQRADKEAEKERKTAARLVQEAADCKPSVAKAPKLGDGTQRGIEASLFAGQSERVDEAVAELVYGDNLPFAVVESPRFKAVIEAAKTAPSSYKLPTRHSLGGGLLDQAVQRLRAEELPLRKACMVHGCTVVSDGWDDIEKNHLINFLVATTKGGFFMVLLS